TQALERALERSLALISGGPGTGKTSIVVTILRVLVRLGLAPADLALAAPTGKAAQRLQASLQAGLQALPQLAGADARLAQELPEAMTLHRLLGAGRRGTWFRHHEHNPLAARVVIVDEASMIDLHLFDRLLRAVRPDARLIVLGDAEQLPAVGSGAVLRDLIPPAGDRAHPLAGSAVRLTQNFRMDAADPQGAAILALAQQVHTGQAGALVARASAAELAFAGAEALFAQPGRDDLGPFLARWYQRIAALEGFAEQVGHTFALDAGAFTAADRARLDALFAHYGRARILCPTRVHHAGVRAINRALHTALLAATQRRGSYAFCPGEPVLMTVNDYEQGLFNGDQGLVLWVQPRPEARALPQAVFKTREGYRAFPLDLLHTRLEHSWALTVHKAQGSEFDHVALVLPSRDTPLLTREVLYTAVTRARRSITILGPRELLELACARTVQRSCGVAERLREG
ncbi:MAG: exodeoxyribonuclease V subunit alpha, partial [Planctomycetes bacterium]|nr:exodeoxyribonuclease V subunit alpha [Planctomycetota bacterium]